MKKTMLVNIALILSMSIANAQESKIVGRWLVTKVEVGSKVHQPYFITEFKADGTMVVMDIEAGTWKYNKRANSIEMESDMDKDFNGVVKILKLEADELTVMKDDVTVYYQKLDESKIAINNTNSAFEGSWRINDSGTLKLVKFELPDSYAIVEKDDNSTKTISGKWIFNTADNTLTVTGNSSLLKGKSTITDFKSDMVVVENNGNKIVLTKENTTKIERLGFTEDDFFTEDGDFKYEADVDKLPWQDPWEMLMSLVNVKQLVYKFSTLVEDTGVFEDKTLSADVNANAQEQSLSIDFIFYGYDRYNLPEDTQLPPNNEYDGLLYPDEENTFRLAGSEQITTPAGTFDCVVVEVITTFETRKKLWMIKGKPGIYAKIIEDNPDENFGHYKIYELLEIKK